jgi:hypothetical protein
VKVKFQIDIYLKTLLKAKRRISFRGSFYLVKGKAKRLAISIGLRWHQSPKGGD